MFLSPTDREALHQAFSAGEPVAADYLARFTGLCIASLIKGGVLTQLGRWGPLSKGECFPDLPTPEPLSEGDLREQREDRQSDHDYERTKL